MDKVKRFIDCYIPTETCNLRCHYCYITQRRKFNSKIAHFSHSLEEIRRAFSKQRVGGVWLINLCAGGETLLSDEVLPVVKTLISEGHYVMIVTNGTLTKRFLEISQFSENICSHLFIKFSFHYLEMVRLGWLERFSENVNLMKNHGVSFTVEITPSDELIPHIDDIKEFCIKHFGALCHVTIARDDRTGGIDVLSELDFDTYKSVWKQFNSELFQFKSEIFYIKRKEFCYAGDWSLYINLESGSIKQCYCGNELGNIYDFSDELHFKAIGYNCTLPHCYNGHAFLTIGDIPEICSTTYDLTRNRTCTDGTEWLQPEMKYIMHSRLQDSNKQFSKSKKWWVSNEHKHFNKFRRLASKIKHFR